MKIIARRAWNPNPWKGTVHNVAISERRHFVVHYHGGAPRYDRGDANALEVWRIHNANGWAGEGYNFIVGQDGAIREGRGWYLVGAHCPGYNRNGIGVYVAIGGTQKPTDAALASVRWLYDEACRRTGRTLTKMGHRDGIATSCPGTHLYAWVRAGMPAPDPTPAPAPTSLSVQSRRGDTGPEVQLLQRMLNAVRGAGLTVDGSFGPGTEKAVVAASQAWSLPEPHNVVGPGFRRRINAEWANPKPAPKEDYMAAISPEDWRHMTTGPAYAFYKNVLADDPETAPRIPLGLAIENATTAALAVKAAIENTPPEGD